MRPNTRSDYDKMVKMAADNLESFWADIAQTKLVWQKPFTKIKNCSFERPVSIKWFEDGELNVTESCVKRHAEQRPDRVAYHFVPDDPAKPVEQITYAELHRQVENWAATLHALGVQAGDRVTIYLPMRPEAIYSMLACARLGAIHSVIFAGFSPDSIAGRIEDAQSHFVITADESTRGGRRTPLKKNMDQALEKTDQVKTVLVVQCGASSVEMKNGRDIWWHDVRREAEQAPRLQAFSAEDPLFLLYTSGSTNKPKGVLHTTGGYLAYAAATHEWVFDYQPGDVYWCAADVGWITGHTYIVYGPLANGATSVLFEGLPTWPTPTRIWEIVDQLKVSILYTAPTAIRALRKEGDAWVTKTSRASLRLLGSVGEPINPEAWRWYHEVVGQGRCPIVDTWWQTETGGILMSPLPHITAMKPGSTTQPLFGVKAELVTDAGDVIEGPGSGNLVITDSWPGQMRTVYNHHDRFEETYFAMYPGKYFTGDGATRDTEGDYWITGRVDDVLNVSGHRLGTAEIESALVAHPEVAEAAVVGFPHEIKGEAIYAYVALKKSDRASLELAKELIQWVRREISPIAAPEKVQFTAGLPKTRSGKIMRRLLRKIAANQFTELGDTSTLADPQVVESLIEERKTLSAL